MTRTLRRSNSTRAHYSLGARGGFLTSVAWRRQCIPLLEEIQRQSTHRNKDWRNMHNTTESSANTEGPVAKAIEQQTAKMPSDWFLWAALSSIGVSLTLQATGKRHASMFVGQWAPTFLILGLYNKLVKVAGSD
jgi:hypothetical protein